MKCSECLKGVEGGWRDGDNVNEAITIRGGEALCERHL